VFDFADFPQEELNDFNVVNVHFQGGDDHVIILIRTNAAAFVPSQQSYRPNGSFLAPYNAWVVFDDPDAVAAAGLYTGPAGGAYASF